MARKADGAESSKQAQRRSIISELHRLMATLAPLRSHPPTRLHILDAVVAKRVGPAANPVDADANGGGSRQTSQDATLRREEFEQTIGTLRRTSRAFSKKAIRSNLSLTSPAEAPSAVNLDRYASLLRERSQNFAELQRFQDPLNALQTALKARSVNALPSSLYVGALGPKMEAPQSAQEASGLVAALSSTVETLAKALRLETYSEIAAAAGDVKAEGDHSQASTYMLTIGGKVLVLDFELACVSRDDPRKGLRYAPKVSLKVSFTNDAGTAAGTTVKNRQGDLAALLKTDVEAIARAMFGLHPDWPDDPVPGSIEVSTEEWLLRAAIARWRRFKRNVQRLARVDSLSFIPPVQTHGDDDVSSDTQGRTDLFASLEQLHQRIIAAVDLNFYEHSSLKCAQHAEHVDVPFTTLVLETNRTAHPNFFRRTLDSAFDEEGCPAPPACLTVDVDIWHWPHSLGGEEEALDSALASVAEDNQTYTLSYVGHLSPPIDLPRSLVIRLARALDLSPCSPVRTKQQRLERSDSEPSNLATNASLRVRLASGGHNDILTISMVPFRTLRQLSEIVEILRQGIWFRRLLTPTKQMKPAFDSLGSLCLADILSSGAQDPVIVDASLDTSARDDKSVAVFLRSPLFKPDTCEIWNLEAWLQPSEVSCLVTGRLVSDEDESIAVELDSGVADEAAHVLDDPDVGSILAVAEVLVRWAKRTAGIAAKEATPQLVDNGEAVSAMEVDEVRTTAAVDMPASCSLNILRGDLSRKRRVSARTCDGSGSGSPSSTSARPMQTRRCSSQQQVQVAPEGGEQQQRASRRAPLVVTGDRSPSPEQQIIVRRSQSPLTSTSPLTAFRRRSGTATDKCGERGGSPAGDEKLTLQQARRRSTSSRSDNCGGL